MKNFYIKTIIGGLVLLATNSLAFAAPVSRQAQGSTAAAIQTAVDQFRADLGGANNGVGGSFTTGRREINWDGVPDANSAPNFLPANFFNVNSPRGVLFQTSDFGSGNFIVSADASNSTNTPVRFGNIDPSYTNEFPVFSAERLFTAQGAHVMSVTFFVPGTTIPATVSGFGVVFSDPDSRARIRYFDAAGNQIHVAVLTAIPDDFLAFIGVSFNAGERISRVEIISGDTPLAAGNVDTNVSGGNVVAMDDFIYGEPRSAQFHSGDFDGDGTSDSAVFRPSTGVWFRLNSGTNTVDQEQFGLNGDIPVDGDFDGDSRADLAVFRPSNGEWYFKRSSNGSVLGAQFGQNGDKPAVGDYDKDGKSDIALWRPSNGNYFILRSSSNFSTFNAYPFGTNGDIPVQGGAQ